MPVDNDIYNDPAVKWWDENEYLYVSTARRIKRGGMTYAEFGRQNRLTVSGDTSVHYLGYGIKR